VRTKKDERKKARLKTPPKRVISGKSQEVSEKTYRALQSFTREEWGGVRGRGTERGAKEFSCLPQKSDSEENQRGNRRTGRPERCQNAKQKRQSLKFLNSEVKS